MLHSLDTDVIANNQLQKVKTIQAYEIYNNSGKISAEMFVILGNNIMSVTSIK
jgi:hypothetical protein